MDELQQATKKRRNNTLIEETSDSIPAATPVNLNNNNNNRQPQEQNGGTCRSQLPVVAAVAVSPDAPDDFSSSSSSCSLSSSSSSYCEESVFINTALYLPGDIYALPPSNVQNHGENGCSGASKEGEEQHDERTLWIPSSSCFSLQMSLSSSSASAANSKIFAVDEVLACIPEVVDRCDELLSVPPSHFTSRSRERIVYVSQGEVAHVTPEQCDIIVSDKATTCHILALQSYTTGTTAKTTTTTRAATETTSENKTASDTGAAVVPSHSLSSMAHIDSTRYDQCVRDMVHRHIQYHYRMFSGEKGKEEKTIQLDIHIMGGFEDDRNISRGISEWLLRLLADLAEEYRHVMKFTLQTCAITCLNDDGTTQRPIGRGLALQVNLPSSVKSARQKGGDCFLASCDRAVMGPCIALRMARVFSRHVSTLHCVHHETGSAAGVTSTFVIPPFRYDEHCDTDMLLSLQDEFLLQCSSTSPYCEEDDFCENMRITLQFLRYVPYDAVFGKLLQYTLKFQRVVENSPSSPNTWQVMDETPQKQQKHPKREGTLRLKCNTSINFRRSSHHHHDHNHKKHMELIRRIQHV